MKFCFWFEISVFGVLYFVNILVKSILVILVVFIDFKGKVSYYFEKLLIIKRRYLFLFGVMGNFRKFICYLLKMFLIGSGFKGIGF